jgi:deferrochelatase/peroxidase EfeB
LASQSHLGKEQECLVFLCYQSSISEQFEVLQKRWANRTNSPALGGGHDHIIGQNGEPGQSRGRNTEIFVTQTQKESLLLPADFVTPTGGGYFFSPSITAIRDFLAT